ncbi:MAG TPA: hypothetical protein VES59_08665 [Bacteroidota bacterium]|nr:hypothetical protein [Bacteroidota bacterium]
MKIRVLIMVLVIAQLWGCSKDEGGPAAKTPAELLAEGWQAYASRNYQLAHDDFAAATQGDANLVDAYNGSGWANAKLNVLAAAVASFNTGLGKDAVNLQMRAGLSFVFNAQKLYTSSIAADTTVLHANSTWSFSRDTSINAADLHLLLAEDYFALTPPDFASSKAQVLTLNPLFAADIATLAGQTALAAEIERLRGIY